MTQTYKKLNDSPAMRWTALGVVAFTMMAAYFVNDVVALSYQANAHMAIVSDSCFHWEPGTYDVDTVLRHAQYSGTHYETLAPLFEGHDWGTVITVADYDSSLSAKEYLARHMTGEVEQVLDISLVNRPTFLAECVGQRAKEVRPILISNTGDAYTVLRR